MVIPTTIYDGGFMAEDNRLCGMNIKTGEVKWYFPTDLGKRHYCDFRSIGYEYRSKLVFQYVIDKQQDISLRSTVCLDVESGTILWEKDCKVSRTIRPVIGSNNDCYFIQDSCRVCKVNMDSDHISEFYYTGDDLLQINDFVLYDNCLVLSCFSVSIAEEYKLETYVIIVDKTTGNEIFRKYLGRSPVGAHSYINDNTLYSNVDRTMMAIDIKTGNIIWERYDMCAYACQDVLFYNDILMKCAVNATIGYDKNTGDVKYLFDDYGSYYVTQQGGYAYFINRQNKLDIIEIETGNKLERIICPVKGVSDFWGPYPTIYDNKLYIIGNNTLYRYPTYPWN